MKRGLLLFAVFTMFAVGSPAQAATQSVAVGDNFYSPSTKTVARGDLVKWTFNTRHTATGLAPLSYWDSGVKTSGTFTTPKALVGAGNYPYFCTVHGSFMKGTIAVPLSLSAVGRKITLKLGSTTAPTGYEYVPQRKSGTSYVAVGTPTTAAQIVFTATAAGTYTFRSAFHKKGTAAPSAAFFSAPVSIKVA